MDRDHRPHMLRSSVDPVMGHYGFLRRVSAKVLIDHLLEFPGPRKCIASRAEMPAQALGHFVEQLLLLQITLRALLPSSSLVDFTGKLQDLTASGFVRNGAEEL